MVQNRCKEYRMEKRIIMLHKVYDIELPYEELGLKTPDKKATITTYIKEMYPDYQDPFNRPLVIICPELPFHRLLCTYLLATVFQHHISE